MTEKLSSEERDQRLPDLWASGWQPVDGRDAIHKTYRFRNFARAIGWMTEAAIWAEKWNHHPEWSNIYNRVDVVLTTHDAGGLSLLDIRLAAKFDDLAK